MASHADKELIELCGKVRDERLSPTELEKLEARLLEDVEARTFYMDFMALHALLERSEPIESLEPTVIFHEQPRSRWLLLAGCAAVIFLGVLTSLLFLNPVAANKPVAHLIDHHGIKLIREGNEIALAGDVELLIGDEVIAATDARALIGFKGEDTAVVIAEETHVQLERSSAGGKLIKLLRGSMSCDVAPQPKDKPMLLQTHHGVFTVLGTQFTLNAKSSESKLRVQEGSVQVEFKGQVAQVNSGSSASIGAQQIQHSRFAGEEPAACVRAFALIQAPEHIPLPEFSPLADGAVIDLANLPTRLLNIEAVVDDEQVCCVLFKLKATSPKGHELKQRGKDNCWLNGHGEVLYPFMLAGDYDDPPKAAEPFGWTPKPGTYVLTATSYENPRFKGRKGPPLTVRFTVIDSAGVEK